MTASRTLGRGHERVKRAYRHRASLRFMGALRSRRRPRPAPTLRPRATLGLLYVTFFFFLYCFALALPAFIEVAPSLPPEPTPDEAQQSIELMRRSLRGKVPIALIASTVTTGLGIYAGLLPGFRSR